MDFSSLARDDYNPKEYAAPEDALMKELEQFTDMSRAGGIRDYYGIGEEGEQPMGKEGCPDCAAGACLRHMGPGEAEQIAALDMVE